MLGVRGPCIRNPQFHATDASWPSVFSLSGTPAPPHMQPHRGRSRGMRNRRSCADRLQRRFVLSLLPRHLHRFRQLHGLGNTLLRRQTLELVTGRM